MKQITRQQAIDDIRRVWLELIDEDHSMCEVASRWGIGCGGFSQWTFEELKERYDWLVRRRPKITREELENLANIWQLARREVKGTQLACDTQTIEHDTCQGWDGWDDDALAQLHFEACGGEKVEVVPDEES